MTCVRKRLPPQFQQVMVYGNLHGRSVRNKQRLTKKILMNFLGNIGLVSSDIRRTALYNNSMRSAVKHRGRVMSVGIGTRTRILLSTTQSLRILRYRSSTEGISRRMITLETLCIITTKFLFPHGI